MNNSDREQFGNLISALVLSHGQEVTDPKIMGYWIGLQDLEIEAVSKAVYQAIKDSVEGFPPPPGKIREMAMGGSADDFAAAAWGDVSRAMALGAYRHVDFKDKHINAAIRWLGGWPAVFDRCATTDSEHWYRLEFIKAYKAARNRGVDGESVRPLAGMSQAECRDGKVIDPTPILIAAKKEPARLECADIVKPLNIMGISQ